MKQMWVVLFIVLGVSSILDARIDRYDEKGLMVYKKHCKQCHGNAAKGAAMKKSREWKKLFAYGAENFIGVHKNVPDNDDVIRLTTRKSKMKHLKKFLMQSASDSGVVMTCDGNFCGR